MDARSWIRHVMSITGLDASGLARRAGLQPSTLTRMLRPDGAGRGVRRSTLEQIADATGVALFADAAGSTAPAELLRAPSTDVPVFATAPSVYPSWHHLTNVIVDHVARLRGVANAAQVFALRMPDSSMHPWRRANELLFIDPARAVALGDHALVETEGGDDGRPLLRVRLMVKMGAKEAILGGYGPKPHHERLPCSEIRSLRRVLEWPELLLSR